MSLAKLQTAEIGPETPLRLSVAAALAFPGGAITASGLRRERDRGRLVVERIAGKDFTTLANIERMRELCRLESNVRGSGSDQSYESVESFCADPPGSSLTAVGISPRDALRTKLKRQSASSPNTLQSNTNRRAKKHDIERIDIADVLSIYFDDTVVNQANRSNSKATFRD